MSRKRMWWMIVSTILVVLFTTPAASAQRIPPAQPPGGGENPVPDWAVPVIVFVAVVGAAVGLRRMFFRGKASSVDLGDEYNSYEDLSLKAESDDPPEKGGKMGDIWVKRIVRVSASPWKLTELRWTADGYEADASDELVRDVSELIHRQRRRKGTALSDEMLYELSDFAQSLGNLMAGGHTWALALDAEIEQIKVIVTFEVYYCTAPGHWQKILEKDFPFKPNYTHVVPVKNLGNSDESLVRETMRVIDALIAELARWPLQAR